MMQVSIAKRIGAACFIAIAMAGCGSGEVLVSIVTVPEEEFSAAHPGYIGWAEWDLVKDPNECTIFVMPKDAYRGDRAYNEVLGHELRHCFDGDYHD